MKTTSTKIQNVNTKNQNQTRVNFSEQFSKELFEAQVKAGRPQNTKEDAALKCFNKQYCNKKVDACIAEAFNWLVKNNPDRANYHFAQAHVWASLAHIDITGRVNYTHKRSRITMSNVQANTGSVIDAKSNSDPKKVADWGRIQ